MFRILLFLSLISTACYGGWAEETLKTLTVREKVGQLFIAPACPKYDKKMIEGVIDRYSIGGVIVKQSRPVQQVHFLNDLQKRSLYPLLVTGDAEWGLGMRMEETLSFPRNNALGLVKNLSLLSAVGEEIGAQCRAVGIHLNFAPVVDVNNNPRNIVIGDRSFGAHPDRVAQCAQKMIWGMKRGGVLSCLKHFPGHGDTEVDSHQGLPSIGHGWEHLEKVEFVPFIRNLDADAIMTGHLLVPILDPTYPASLSKAIATDLLQKKWGFTGLVITDALNMKALTNHYSTEEIAVLAFHAGHDLLLYGSHRYEDVAALLKETIPRAYNAILKQVEEGKISRQELDRRVLKVLRAKERLGLARRRLTPLRKDLMDRLHAQRAQELIIEIKKSAP